VKKIGSKLKEKKRNNIKEREMTGGDPICEKRLLYPTHKTAGWLL